MAVTVDDERVHIGLSEVRIGRRGVAALVVALDPDAVPFGDVTEMWEAFDGIERLAANAKALLAARVEHAGDWKRAGARSAAEHLAKMSGTTTAAARRSLETSRQVEELAEVGDALRGGELSTTQLDAIVPAAAADPSAAGRLIALAHTTNVAELREECLRTAAAADPDPDATHARIQAQR